MFSLGKGAVVLDRDGEEPIYRQLIRYIKTEVDSGSLPSGTRLPASRDLAQQLNISRISVVNAYAELRSEGYLSAHAGRGTFVSKDVTHGAQSEEGRSEGYRQPHVGSPDRSLREMMRLSRRPGVISFGPGAPPPELLPVQYLRDAINTVLDRDGARALTYEETEGYAPLRSAVRDYVSALGIQCSSNEVLITGGVQQALDLVIQALVSEGETIVTEEPTYIGVVDIAQMRRVQLHGIPMDDDGIRLDILENYIIDHQPKLIYVMPTFQNPTGKVMSLHRRRQLINLAVDYNIPILEDGVYHEFRFEGEPLPPLHALDENGVVIHASGFTKTLLPGIRIGYIIAPVAYYTRFVRVKQAADISTSGLNQRAIHLMLQRGIMSQQLEINNREFRKRRNAALEAARRHFPQGTRWHVPNGGMHLWLTLPRNGPTAPELYITAIQKGVGYAIGSVYYTRNPDNYTIRINFSAHRPAEIEEGFRRLGEAWQHLVHEYGDIEKSPLL